VQCQRENRRAAASIRLTGKSLSSRNWKCGGFTIANEKLGGPDLPKPFK